MINCQELILSKLSLKGKGEFPSPIRELTQVFTKEGQLIAEYDPMGNYSIEDIFSLSNAIAKGQSVEIWLKENFNLVF